MAGIFAALNGTVTCPHYQTGGHGHQTAGHRRPARSTAFSLLTTCSNLNDIFDLKICGNMGIYEAAQRGDETKYNLVPKDLNIFIDTNVKCQETLFRLEAVAYLRCQS